MADKPAKRPAESREKRETEPLDPEELTEQRLEKVPEGPDNLRQRSDWFRRRSGGEK